MQTLKNTNSWSTITMYQYLKQIERFFRSKRKKRLVDDSPLFARTKKFRHKYPDYEIGLGSYGLPIVFDWQEDSTLKIGSFCSISDNVRIYLGGHHRTDWASSYPFPAFVNQAAHITEYGFSNGDVIIGSDVWLCANAIILSGVTIGHGAVIANGAVVTKNVEPYAIMGGNPAKLIRYRFDEPIRNRLLHTAWWEWPETKILSKVELLCSNDIEAFLSSIEK